MEENKTEIPERIDGKYIWKEIANVLNFKKGLFYTIREVFLRPRKTVRNFLFNDRKKLVRPILFVMVTSLIYSIVNYYFNDIHYVQGSDLENSMVDKMFRWGQENYGYANIIAVFFTTIFTKLFFKKFDYNFFEIFVLLSFLKGIEMLILSLSSLFYWIFQTELLYIKILTEIFIVFTYNIFAITDFFDKTKIKNYFKSFASYILGMISFYFLIIFVGVIIDLYNGTLK